MSPGPPLDPAPAAFLVLAGRVDRLLAQARAAQGIAERRYALEALAQGLLWADPGTVGAAEREAARALAVDPSALASASRPRLPHAVAVPLAAPGRSSAIVRQLHVAYDPVGLPDPGAFGARARRGILAALDAAAARVAPPTPVASHRLVAARPEVLREVHIEGGSLAASAFLSAVALWTGRQLRTDRAVSGALSGGRLAPVGDVALKVAAGAARADLRALVVPVAVAAEARRIAAGGSGVEVIGVDDLDDLVEALVEGPRRLERPEALVEEARRHFAQGWRGYRWPSVREHLGRVSGILPEARVDLRVEVLGRLAAAERHLGDPVASLRALSAARSIADGEEGRRAVPDGPRTYLEQQTAMTLRQLERLPEAARAARRGAAIARRARLRGELVKALGCVGLVALSRRRVGEAVEAFAEALALQQRHDPQGTPRSQAYLIDALGVGGDEAGVHEAFEGAQRALARLPADVRRGQEAWVRSAFAGALLRLGQPAEAAEALDVEAVRPSLAEEPLPGLRIRRVLGVALARSGDPMRGYELLGASVAAYGRALAPHHRTLAHLNVLHEARERLAEGALGRDATARARRALAWIELGAPGVRSREAPAVGRLLDRHAAGRRVGLGALDRLLDRVERLA
ncbi:MAG: hypothetical protein ACFCGT_19265 [Sandaracinaceae bacterium]